ncbi:hypothetical protein [Simplicispira metamorpha]|uniref:hypothetical protein n=1 Tax=Simplicispira metamorpha TaxID=80881 RepID=UPI00104CCFB8|nr:hypothetical protein [Simplicispira metamorpha]
MERNKQLSRLTNLVADILTVTKGKAKQLLEQHPQDAEGLYNALIFARGNSPEEGGMADAVSQKWRGTTMALLPASDWISHQGPNPDAFLVRQDTLGNHASLRHVSLQTLDYRESFDPARDRVALLKELRSKLPASVRAQFQSLLTLISEAETPFLKRRLAAYPHNDDLHLLLLIENLEHLFNVRKHDAERVLRRRHDYPDTVPTPPNHFVGLANAAYKAALADFSQTDGPTTLDFSVTVQNEPGHLILMVMFNICANRQLLERARQQALTATAGEANGKFLDALNRAGIHELDTFEFSGRNPKWAPGHPRYALYQNCAGASLDDYEAALDGMSLVDCTRAGLVAQFGPGSQWAKTAGCKPLLDYDLNWVMRLAEVNHEHFRGTRLGGREATYVTWHTAVMAVMACWHSNPSVQKVHAPSERQVRAFPARNAGREWSPTAEHLALYAVMTGQLLFGNSGLTLRSDTVAEYVQAHVHIHAATQGLISKVFKQGSPRMLLAYSIRLSLAGRRPQPC